jgi:adenine deaminase
MIREGTVAKDLINLIPVINEQNFRRCLFVTDDRHLDDIVSEGSIDHNVRLSIKTGVPPITAIQMATINAAECFGLKEQGAIAPGYKADFLLLDDLDSVIIHSVFKDGNLMVQNNRLLNFPADEKQVIDDGLKRSVHFHEITGGDFAIPLKTEFANIIEITPNSLITKHSIESVTLNHNGLFQFSEHVDHLKLAVIERHHMTKRMGLGIVKGLGLKSGAIATTVAHDSHNLIIAGTNDKDIFLAAKEIKKMQAGQTLLYKSEDQNLNLQIKAIHFKLEEKDYQLLTLQNIKSELDFREMESLTEKEEKPKTSEGSESKKTWKTEPQPGKKNRQESLPCREIS